MKKIILIVLDGLGDEPIPSFEGKTPLEEAKTFNLDKMAKEGLCLRVKPFHPRTAIPTSEGGHFSLFGYDPGKHDIGRGIFTAKGAGLKVEKGDVALRGNFGTVDKDFNMTDRRAGRIKETQPLIDELDGMVLEGIKFLIKSGKEHRIGIVMKGKGLSCNISDGDPHYSKMEERVRRITPLDKSREAKFTSGVLNKFLEKSHLILKKHPLNLKRERENLPVANYILTRGASSIKEIPSFKDKYGFSSFCVAGKLLYRQIAEELGMEIVRVKGATGLPDTNLKGKFEAVLDNIGKHDFAFLHIKAADSLAEDGNFKGKKEFIERVDKEISSFLSLENVLIAVTGDHSTCSLLKRHCDRPFPLLIFGNGKDLVKDFSEKACSREEISQLEIMEKLINLAKK